MLIAFPLDESYEILIFLTTRTAVVNVRHKGAGTGTLSSRNSKTTETSGKTKFAGGY